MNCPLVRISENSPRGRREEAISGIRREAGDEGAGSGFEGHRARDKVSSSEGHFWIDAPDHQEDAGRLSGAGTPGVERPTPGAAVIRRAPYALVEKVLCLYAEEYFDFNVKHFYEQLVQRHGLSCSFTGNKNLLQEAG